MKMNTNIMIALIVAGTTLGAYAEEATTERDGSRKEERRAKRVERFDKDADGKLTGKERKQAQHAREKHQERRENKGERNCEKGERGERGGEKGERAERGERGERGGEKGERAGRGERGGNAKGGGGRK
jgi:hypothetical protein